MTPQGLLADWHARAVLFREHGAVETAQTIERLAGELEATLRDTEHAPLTLAEASAESGLSRDHLSRLIREGKIPNAGRRHAPRIARADLPRKASALLSSPAPRNIADARRRAVRAVIAQEH